jgi:NADH:ubiquinone oxidoreductase subunit 6 (subunit J)
MRSSFFFFKLFQTITKYLAILDISDSINENVDTVVTFSENQHAAVVVLFINALFFGSFIIICQNPIYSLLALIVTFASIVFVFIIIKIEFLALTFLIIYVGAIAILFLFVIMMFNIKRMSRPQISIEFFYIVLLTYLFVPKLFIILLEYIEQYIFICNFNLTLSETLSMDFVLNYDNLTFLFKYKTTDAVIFSDLLYTYYAYCFGLIGVVLLSAMLGSIVLALLSSEKEN